MADFAGRYARLDRGERILKSNADNDFYKETMGQFTHRHYRGKRVRFRFINRHKHIPLGILIDLDELRAELDHARSLRTQPEVIDYLRNLTAYHPGLFTEEYLAFRAAYQLPPYELRRVGDQIEFTAEGNWEDVSPWETIFLAILSELLYRTLMREMKPYELEIMYTRAKNKLHQKLLLLKRYPTLYFADFGFRRRHSADWHSYAIEMAKEILGEQFTGASSTWMAMKHDVKPIGTNAHELPMVLTALADTDEEKLDAQYEVLRKWGGDHPEGPLRIVLPDTYGSRQFWKNMPEDLAEEVAHHWRGVRLDSGDPFDETERLVRWYRGYSIDPWNTPRVAMPSDGNDTPIMIKFHEVHEGIIHHQNGWGTMFSNDFDGCHPRADERAVLHGFTLPLTWNDLFKGHSLVAKPDLAEGRPVVKLSNNVNKATGPKDEVERYLRIFRPEGRIYQDVLV